MNKFNKNDNSVLSRLKKDQTYLIPIVVAAIAYFIFISYKTLTLRIQTTGWEAFPANLLDWFAITGSATSILIIAAGCVGIYVLIFNPDSIKN